MSQRSFTEDLKDVPPTGKPESRVRLLEKLADLRQKLSRKAKQEMCNCLRVPEARVSGKAGCGKSARPV